MDKTDLSIVAVIRSSGERTEDVCRDIVASQIGERNTYLIKEKPFSAAVRKTYEIGIASKKKWTLAVDADILLCENAILKLVSNAESLDKKIKEKLFVYQGNFVCKIFGKLRHVGCHLYQTKHLKRCMDFLDETASSVRPESANYYKMVDVGYYHYIDNNIYGLHAYEQSFEACFRNGFFQAKKHKENASKFIMNWEEKLNIDLDYQAFIYGFFSGLVYRDVIKVDIDFLNSAIRKDFLKIDFTPKAKIQDINSILRMVDTIKLEYSKRNKLTSSLMSNKKPKILFLIKRRIGNVFLRIGSSIHKL